MIQRQVKNILDKVHAVHAPNAHTNVQSLHLLMYQPCIRRITLTVDESISHFQ